jgi:hypothetical protein
LEQGGLFPANQMVNGDEVLLRYWIEKTSPWYTVRVKFWVALGKTPLLAVMING